METLISDLRELPSAVSAELQALREMDRVSRDLADQISTDEAKLFQDIADAAKIDSGFDEAPFKERFQSVTHRKQDLVALLDEQTKKAQAIYNKVDLKISIFDASTKKISHLFPQSKDEMGALSKRKKKRKAALDPQSTNAFADAVMSDPNEPLYCYCRQISYGVMVACENRDCAIEWFHFPCVGLSEEAPPDCWFCPECRKSEAADDTLT